jgi:hypothetical protein
VRPRLTVISEDSRTLNVQRASGVGRVVLAWPVSPVPLQLQYTDLLPPLAGWGLVPEAPVASGQVHRVTNTVPGTSRFYRLAQP